jgi:hypothetical protein
VQKINKKPPMMMIFFSLRVEIDCRLSKENERDLMVAKNV